MIIFGAKTEHGGIKKRLDLIFILPLEGRISLEF